MAKNKILALVLLTAFAAVMFCAALPSHSHGKKQGHVSDKSVTCCGKINASVPFPVGYSGNAPEKLSGLLSHSEEIKILEGAPQPVYRPPENYILKYACLWAFG